MTTRLIMVAALSVMTLGTLPKTAAAAPVGTAGNNCTEAYQLCIVRFCGPKQERPCLVWCQEQADKCAEPKAGKATAPRRTNVNPKGGDRVAPGGSLGTDPKATLPRGPGAFKTQSGDFKTLTPPGSREPILKGGRQ